MLPGSVVHLLERQYSFVANHQLRTECTPAERRRCRRDPYLEPVGARVLRHRVAPPQLGQQLLAPVLDAVHVARPLVVEVHSEALHTMPSDIERDEQRVRRLLEAGFSVVIYWEYDIWHDAPVVRSSLRGILSRPDGRLATSTGSVPSYVPPLRSLRPWWWGAAHPE